MVLQGVLWKQSCVEKNCKYSLKLLLFATEKKGLQLWNNRLRM